MRSIEELEAVVEEEKRKYEERRKAFFANPRNWSNNKRRRAGLAPLRGSLNKYRPSPPQFNYSIVFPMIEDIIDETLPQKINESFNEFVECKSFSYGDRNNEFKFKL